MPSKTTQAAEEGLEREDVTCLQSNGLRQSPIPIGTDSGTLGDEMADFPPDLQSVIDAWPNLPDHAHRAIMAIVGGSPVVVGNEN